MLTMYERDFRDHRELPFNYWGALDLIRMADSSCDLEPSQN